MINKNVNVMMAFLLYLMKSWTVEKLNVIKIDSLKYWMSNKKKLVQLLLVLILNNQFFFCLKKKQRKINIFFVIELGKEKKKTRCI